MAADPLPTGLTPGLIWLARNANQVAREQYWAAEELAYPSARSMDRFDATVNSNAIASGTLYLTGGAILLPDIDLASIMFFSGSTAAVTPTNQWACFVHAETLAVLAKTNDRTTEAWAANTAKYFDFATPYSPSEVTPVYFGIVVVAATPNTLRGTTGLNIGPAALNPQHGGTSTAALTDPASLGATAAAPGAPQTAHPYAHAVAA